MALTQPGRLSRGAEAASTSEGEHAARVGNVQLNAYFTCVWMRSAASWTVVIFSAPEEE